MQGPGLTRSASLSLSGARHAGPVPVPLRPALALACLEFKLNLNLTRSFKLPVDSRGAPSRSRCDSGCSGSGNFKLKLPRLGVTANLNSTSM